MRVECELVRDDLTQEERDDLAARNAANREAGSKRRDRLFAATATCLRCGNECRGTGSTRTGAEKSAIEEVDRTCSKTDSSGSVEMNRYVKRSIPPGCVLQGQFTNGKWFTCHVVGWTVCAECGEVSKVAPLRLIAQDGCEPDRKLMLKFATRLAGRGYRISVSDEKAPGPKRKRTKAKSEISKS